MIGAVPNRWGRPIPKYSLCGAAAVYVRARFCCDTNLEGFCVYYGHPGRIGSGILITSSVEIEEMRARRLAATHESLVITFIRKA